MKATSLAEQVDHSPLLPPVFDQGPAGTCVACATAYYDKTFQKGLEHHWTLADPHHQFSPLYIYSQRRKQPADEGMTIREAMKIIQEQGVCSLDCMPYNVQRINVPPTPEQRKAATPYRAKSYARLNSVIEMEAYLMTNCFVAGVMVHERFMDAPGGIIPMWDEAYTEPFHALLRRYADTVVASFAGHTHMDDFRLIGDSGGHYAFALTTCFTSLQIAALTASTLAVASITLTRAGSAAAIC